MAGADNDPFDSLFTLEDKYYRDGFQQGSADGARAGRIEGRLFGYEKAFEKFIRVGTLHGRAIVLQSRLGTSELVTEPPTEPAVLIVASRKAGTAAQEAEALQRQDRRQGAKRHRTHGEALYVLPPLPQSQRLAKHVDVLHALTEPATFSTQNDESAVADLDDRLRRAEAKAKLIDRLLGVAGDAELVLPGASAGQSQARLNGGKKASGDMEEFVVKAGKARTAG